MKCYRKSRGSALLLVVGLLAMIALLGGSFLIISRFNARTSEALVSKATSIQVALGALARVKAALVADLYIDSSGRYHGNAPTPAGADRFADVGGDLNAYGISGSTGVRDSTGVEYTVAITATDMSGLLNVNTACKVPAATVQLSQWPPSQSCVNLYRFMTSIDMSFRDVYYNLNSYRSGHPGDVDNYGDLDPNVVLNNVALRVFNPAGGYSPFGINDELFLRLSFRAGRLYNALNPPGGMPVGADVFGRMTTHSCSSSLVRNPTDGFRRRLLITAGTNDITDSTNGTANRQRLYDALVGAGVPASEAAHFVANLWAYLTPSSTAASGAFAVSYSGGTAYGIVRQPFIVEAYAAFKPADPNSTVPEKWFAAVELFNPDSTAIDLGSYTLAGVALSGSLGSSGRMVFYNHNCPSDADAASTFSLTLTSWTRINNAGFRFYQGGSIALRRTAGGASIPIDSVSATELGHSASSSTSAQEYDNMRRDDDPVRARYSVAGHVNSTTNSHTLGSANGVTASQITTVYEGFNLLVKHGRPECVGDLADVYVTGPNSNGRDLPHALLIFGTSASRGRANFDHTTTSAAPYPQVAWPMLLGEFFEMVPPDSLQPVQLGGQSVATRIYGRMNINTTSEEVLRFLPFPAWIDTDYNGIRSSTEMTTSPFSLTGTVSWTGAAAAIVGGRPYSTPGQVASVLGDYATAGTAVGSASYRSRRDWLYRVVSNAITVNSDTYVVEIVVQLGTQQSRYIGVIDRSNCVQPGDTPAVLMFCQGG